MQIAVESLFFCKNGNELLFCVRHIMMVYTEQFLQHDCNIDTRGWCFNLLALTFALFLSDKKMNRKLTLCLTTSVCVIIMYSKLFKNIYFVHLIVFEAGDLIYTRSLYFNLSLNSVLRIILLCGYRCERLKYILSSI